MIDIIKEKLRKYAAGNTLEEESAVKEILQEIALYSLWRGDFFDVLSSRVERAFASFMGCRAFPRISISSCESLMPVSTGRPILRFSPT